MTAICPWPFQIWYNFINFNGTLCQFTLTAMSCFWSWPKASAFSSMIRNQAKTAHIHKLMKSICALIVFAWSCCCLYLITIGTQWQPISNWVLKIISCKNSPTLLKFTVQIFGIPRSDQLTFRCSTRIKFSWLRTFQPSGQQLAKLGWKSNGFGRKKNLISRASYAQI